VISITLAAALQLTGISAILNFAPKIFAGAGMTNNLSTLLATVGVGVFNSFSTLLALALSDRFGRRTQLFVGLTVMILCDTALGVVFAIGVNQHSAWLAILFVCSFVIGFEFSIGTLFWTLLVESFESDIVALASSLMTFLHFFFSLLVIAFFNVFVDLIGSAGVFWMFASFGALSFVILFFMLPETKPNIKQIQNDKEILPLIPN
jgi:MFS family permease